MLRRLVTLAEKRGTETASEALYPRMMLEWLWPVLPPEQGEAHLLTALRMAQETLNVEFPLPWLLSLNTHPWSEELGRAVLKMLGHCVRYNSVAPRDWEVRRQMKNWAHRIPVSLVGEAYAQLSLDENFANSWSSAVNDLLTILEFRFTMLAGLGKDSS
jgi:hypothetical protein